MVVVVERLVKKLKRKLPLLLLPASLQAGEWLAVSCSARDPGEGLWLSVCRRVPWGSWPGIAALGKKEQHYLLWARGLGDPSVPGVQEELDTKLELCFQSTPLRLFPLQSPRTAVTVEELNQGISHPCPPVCPGPFLPTSPQASPH